MKGEIGMEMGMPIIRLEVQGMKRAVVHALTEYAAAMGKDIQAAVEEACQPERVLAVIRAIAQQEIENAIKEELVNFFRSGKGRTAVKEAVISVLEKQE